MKLVFTIVMMGLSLCAMAQRDALPSGVYSEGEGMQLHSVVKKQVLTSKTLDLSKLDIYTLTLSPGQSYMPPAGDDMFERLIVVKSGKIKLILADSAQNVGVGSVALVLPTDQIRYQNLSNEPASWYVLNFTSVNPANGPRGDGAGPSFIKNWDKLKVSRSDKGESRNIFDRPTAMFERFEVHATALNPGYASHEPHTHRVEEIILMLTGNVLETIGQEKKPAKAGDIIYLASGILHRPLNNGNKQCYYLAIQWHNLKND